MDGCDAPAAMAAGAPGLVFWTGSWGVLKGERQILTIIGPDGSVFMSAERVLERNRATESRWIGRKRRSEPWPPGRYRGLYRLERQVGGAPVTVSDVQREGAEIGRASCRERVGQYV